MFSLEATSVFGASNDHIARLVSAITGVHTQTFRDHTCTVFRRVFSGGRGRRGSPPDPAGGGAGGSVATLGGTEVRTTPRCPARRRAL